MKIVFSPEAWEDYQYWQATDDVILKRINLLIKDSIRTPFSGLGKPETLKANLQGFWSRRIDREHRLVYRVQGSGAAQTLEIIQYRYHY
jgi:toxin YoeB